LFAWQWYHGSTARIFVQANELSVAQRLLCKPKRASTLVYSEKAICNTAAESDAGVRGPFALTDMRNGNDKLKATSYHAYW